MTTEAPSQEMGVCGELGCATCGALACRAPMVVRTNRQNGSEFLACSHYAACLNTRGVPEAYRLRKLGYSELPGFGCVEAQR